MKKLIPLLLAILLLSQTWPVLAQQEDTGWQRFTSEDGLLTVSFPDVWVAEALDTLGVVFGNSEAALERLLTDDENMIVESGELTVSVTLLPADSFVAMGLDLLDDPTQANLTVAFGALMAEQSAINGIKVRDPIEVELEDGDTITILPITIEERSIAGFIAIWVNKEGVGFVGSAIGFADEFNEDDQALTLKIITSAEYTGTTKDIQAALDR